MHGRPFVIAGLVILFALVIVLEEILSKIQGV